MAEQDESTKSLAPTCRVFISYSHDSPEHQQRVLSLANQLRKDGVDARIDQYVQDPNEGWIRWMRSEVKQADRVLLIFTEIYQRRFEGDEQEGKGLGASFEGVIVTQTLYESEGRNAKFRPVVFHEEDKRFIPSELRRFNRYRVDTQEHYQNLLRWLYAAPLIVAPTIGQKPNLPSQPVSELFSSKREREEQERMEHESPSPPPLPVSSTSSDKTELYPAARTRRPMVLSCSVTLLVLVIGLFVGGTFYFFSGSKLQGPPQVVVQPSAQPTPPIAVAVIPSPSIKPSYDATVRGTITIATVNNPDMIELKKLSARFKDHYPAIELTWVILEENVLRQRVTTDVSTGGGRFDLVFIGLYETPIFAKRGWLKEIANSPADYDIEDVFKSIRDGLSYDGKLYALPFYGESSMLMYRKDLFDEKGLKMPDRPTYDDIHKFADALTDRTKGVYGITLRGKPGWGQNMAYLGTLINTFGGTWFDMSWHPTIDTPEWMKATTFYIDLMTKDGPPEAYANGFNENLTLFADGKAAMWIDATAAGGWLENPQQSQVAGKIGYAPSPIEVTPNGSHWLWSWAFSIPTAAKNTEAAERFAEWATSKEYIRLVADDLGWASVPPGTRKSTYDNPEYRKAAPFAPTTLQAMQTADPTNPAIRPVPYTGIQFVDIPEFQSIGTLVGEYSAGALAGKMSVTQALKASQIATERAVLQGGYNK
jgi:sorbitol/mannitol transport system substrate-binding protein